MAVRKITLDARPAETVPIGRPHDDATLSADERLRRAFLRFDETLRGPRRLRRGRRPAPGRRLRGGFARRPRARRRAREAGGDGGAMRFLRTLLLVLVLACALAALGVGTGPAPKNESVLYQIAHAL